LLSYFGQSDVQFVDLNWSKQCHGAPHDCLQGCYAQ
jgi:hypothetical protein